MMIEDRFFDQQWIQELSNEDFRMLMYLMHFATKKCGIVELNMRMLNFAANTGTDICAFASGTVIAAGKDAGYGNYLKLDHGSGYVTLYGHCSELLVSEGDPVQAGQVIARVGATGQATGPHLHFELMHDGVYLNPEFYLAA